MKCTQCQKPLDGLSHPNRKFCSPACCTRFHAITTERGFRLSTGTLGAVGELTVSADLLKQGFEVFRSVSQSCSCDLIAAKAGRLLRIECRAGYTRKDGSVIPSKKQKDVGRQDHFAILLPDGRIVYQPALAT